MIVGGDLPLGVRISELALVERLGVSRTPVRAALLRLAEEGLLAPMSGGGFASREFGESDIHDAIELRGTLEVLAARLAAERAVGTLLMAQRRDCVTQIDDLLAPSTLSDSAFSAYADLNARFHQLLAKAAGSGSHQARDSLVLAQQQHRAVIEAIAQREGARAEGLMREHARIADTNLRAALVTPHGRQAQPFWVELPRHGLRLLLPAERKLLRVLGVQGQIDHPDVFLSPAERAASQRLCACVSRVCGDAADGGEAVLVLDGDFRPDPGS